MKRLFQMGGVSGVFAAALLGLGAVLATATGAAAQDGAERIGQSEPGQLNLQEPVTLVGRLIYDLHSLMLVIITGITLFVLALLVWVIVRYNAKANPTPQSWTHNTKLEVAWTLAPIVILVVIAIPSVQLLILQEDFESVEPDVTIKAIGQPGWWWTYEYVEHGVEGQPDVVFTFDSFMVGRDAPEMTDEIRAELAALEYLPDVPDPERFWKLATDQAVVVPVGANVLVEVTADPTGVQHAWAVPSFGVKADAYPGRLNRTWFNVEAPGVYFGQCSELCGAGHAYMPIAVKAVSPQEYEAWVAGAIQNFAGDVAPEQRLAAAPAID